MYSALFRTAHIVSLVVRMINRYSEGHALPAWSRRFIQTLNTAEFLANYGWSGVNNRIALGKNE